MKDKIISLLGANHPWADRIFWYDSISSTNDVLKKLAQEGAPSGTVLISGHQTGGRGRLGRTFLSPPDVGIYMSVLLRPNCNPSELMHLTCASAVYACEAISNAAGFNPEIKWTNDIIYQKHKLSGILTELGFQGNGNVDYAIIGIGINCNQKTEDFPPEIQSFAGSLSMFSKAPIDRALVAARMVDAFFKMNQNLFSGKQDILSSYRKKCATLGQDVSIVRGDEIRHGKALDIDDGGSLIALIDGKTEIINSGEVSVRGLYHYV